MGDVPGEQALPPRAAAGIGYATGQHIGHDAQARAETPGKEGGEEE